MKRLLSLILVLLCCATAWGQVTITPATKTWNNLASKPEITVGDTGYTTFAAAVTAISSTSATLVIPSGNHVAGGVTVPANVQLRPVKGAIFTVANGTTFTINGPCDAGLYQIFSCTGTGKVDLSGAKGMPFAPVEWWGCVGDASTDNLAAYLKARDSKANLKIGDGDYWMSDTIDVYSGQNLFGNGINSKITITHATGGYAGAIFMLQGAGAGFGAEFDAGGNEFSIGNIVSGIHFVGGNRTNECAIGLNHAKNTIVENCYFTAIGYKAYTAQIEGYGNIFRNSTIISAGTHADNRPSFSFEVVSGAVIGNTVDNITIMDKPTTAFTISGGAAGNIIKNIKCLGGVDVRVGLIDSSPNNVVDIVYVYGASGNGASSPVYVSGAASINNIVRNITIEGLWTGQLCGAGTSASNNLFENVRGSCTAQIIYANAPGNTFRNIVGTSTTAYGVQVSSSGSYTRILDCDLALTAAGTIRVLYVQAGGNYCTVNNNKITIPATGRVAENAGDYCVFKNNVCPAVGSAGGWIQGGKGNLLEGNRMFGTAAAPFNITTGFNKIVDNVYSEDAIAFVPVVANGQTAYHGNSWQPSITWLGAAPTTAGTYKKGAQVFSTVAVTGAPSGWVCTVSGTFSAYTDATGDTDGSTNAITGMTSTTGLLVGQYVSVSAGFASTGPYKVIEITSSTAIKIEVNSNAVATNITVATPDPTFKAMANLP